MYRYKIIGCREGSNRHSFRIVAGFWVLVGMVLVNCYSGIVISSLTVPRMKPAVESLNDLATSEDVGVIIRSDIVIGQQILVLLSLRNRYYYNLYFEY